jgi:hypothetical protein
MSFGISTGGQSWDSQSWGNSLIFSTAVGAAAANITQNLTIAFLANTATSNSDTVLLGNFTVVRYPAQTNP